jgi:hypothetical protein
VNDPIARDDSNATNDTVAPDDYNTAKKTIDTIAK